MFSVRPRAKLILYFPHAYQVDVSHTISDLPGAILLIMENWAKGIGTACTVCASLFLWVVAILFEYVAPPSVPAILVIAATGMAFFIWGLVLYRKVIHSIGRGTAFLRVLAWLAIFLVVLPNFLMALLLSGFSLLKIVLGVFAFVFASPYYGIPAELFGEELFLMETVISPNGFVGLLLSALFWAAVVVVNVSVLHVASILWDGKKHGGIRSP